MYDDVPEDLKARILDGAGEVAKRYGKPAPPSQRMASAKVERVDKSGTVDIDLNGAALQGVPMTTACHEVKAGDTVLVESYRAELVATGIMSDGIPDPPPPPPPKVKTRTVSVSTTPNGNAGVGLFKNDCAIMSAYTDSMPDGKHVVCIPYLFKTGTGELGVHCVAATDKHEVIGEKSLTLTVRYHTLD